MTHRLLATALLCSTTLAVRAQAVAVDPSSLPRLGAVDARFQSYNIEMVEVIGGRFWRPYSEVNGILNAPPPSASGSVGMDPNLYQQRTPIDLYNPKLRKLAQGLAPAYVRVSGTWANTTYFQNDDAPTLAQPPAGFNGVLTRKQWRGVIDFSKAVDAKLVTSVATSPGARDASGVWTSDQARAVYEYTRSLGGTIAATEFMNEPTFAAMGGAPKGYDSAAYGRDLAAFKPFLRKQSPGTLLLGPGSVGEGGALGAAPIPNQLPSASLLKATGDVYDAFSYHYYGAVSKRCAVMGPAAQTSPAVALTAGWLDQTDQVEGFYAGLRDTYAPGKPLWLTETGDAACGGNPWAVTFLDSFRYLHQLGALARRGVHTVMHNTLAASDYGLIDEKTLTPRPNYWAAYLWAHLMGDGVLGPQEAPAPDLYVYAHCERSHAGGVTLLVINADTAAVRHISVPLASQRYTLSAASLSDGTVQLNGKPLSVTANDDLPTLAGAPQASGELAFAPESITFLTIPEAHNRACR